MRACRSLVMSVVALLALAVSPPAAAHENGKAKPRIAAAFDGEGLSGVLTVRLTDTDSDDVIRGARVRAGAETTRPHAMRTAANVLQELRPGEYVGALRFPMAAIWTVTIGVSGPQVVSASARLRVTTRVGAAEPKAAESNPVPLATHVEDDISRRDLLSMAVLWTHSLAALGWITGVLVLALVLGPRPTLVAANAHRRLADWYRRWGAWLHWGLVPVIVLTGVYNMLRVTPFTLLWRPSDLGRLGDIPYGPLYEVILLVKLALFGVLLVTGTLLLLRTTRTNHVEAADGASYVRVLTRALGPAGLVYLATVPLILAAAMALRYVHVLSHVAETLEHGG